MSSEAEHRKTAEFHEDLAKRHEEAARRAEWKGHKDVAARQRKARDAAWAAAEREREKALLSGARGTARA
jgi:hypothetical protein